MDYHHGDEVYRSPQGHGLFLGDIQAAEDIDWLRKNNIRTVITAASGWQFKYGKDIKHITYHLQDKKSQNASAYFDMAGFQIDKHLRTNGVLVHCGAGVSRSTTLVIGYLIKYRNMTFLESLRMLKTKRPCICPNLGFQLQLKSYQKSHSAPSHALMQSTRKRQKKQPLPELLKSSPMHTTTYNGFNRQFMGKSAQLSDIHNHKNMSLSISKSLRPVDSQQKELQYLRKMAEFRFGITNMSKWRIGAIHSRNKPLGY